MMSAPQQHCFRDLKEYVKQGRRFYSLLWLISARLWPLSSLLGLLFVLLALAQAVARL
jgi:hypothetical protein